MSVNKSCLIIISFLAAIMISGCAAMHSKPGTTTTVILIRHAEKDEKGFLSEKGHEHAKALVGAVMNLGVQKIYSPDLGRNLDTVRPLAEHLGIDITLTPTISVPMVGSICEEILTEHAGKVVLWVGNVSGNLQLIYKRLGGEGTGPVEYGQLYILTIPDKGSTHVVKTTF